MSGQDLRSGAPCPRRFVLESDRSSLVLSSDEPDPIYSGSVLPHGQAELRALADLCAVDDGEVRGGWHLDRWRLGDEEVSAVAEVYAAVLSADTIDAEISDILLDEGIDLTELLLAQDDRKDDTTRADAVELAAAASLLAVNEWPDDTLHMPNVPKMARKKSDSGIDVTAVKLVDSAAAELVEDERLFLASVKHSIDPDARGLRYKLVKSVKEDLGAGYMAGQLRVLHGNLVREGMARHVATRIFQFMRHLNSGDRVTIHAVAAIDSDAEVSFESDLAHLPALPGREIGFRIALIPDLPNLHLRCV